MGRCFLPSFTGRKGVLGIGNDICKGQESILTVTGSHSQVIIRGGSHLISPLANQIKLQNCSVISAPLIRQLQLLIGAQLGTHELEHCVLCAVPRRACTVKDRHKELMRASRH